MFYNATNEQICLNSLEKMDYLHYIFDGIVCDHWFHQGIVNVLSRIDVGRFTIN